MLMRCKCKNVWEASETKRGHGVPTEHDGSCPLCGRQGRKLSRLEMRVRRAADVFSTQRLKERRFLIPPPEAVGLFGLGRFTPMNSDGSGGKVKRRLAL